MRARFTEEQRQGPKDGKTFDDAYEVTVVRENRPAGQAYWFFENTFMGLSNANARLSRQSEALVRAEIAGTYYSEWRPKVR